MAIVENEDIRDGKPVIAGSRVTVEDVVKTFYGLERSVGQVADDYGISEEEVEGALREETRES